MHHQRRIVEPVPEPSYHSEHNDYVHRTKQQQHVGQHNGFAELAGDRKSYSTSLSKCRSIWCSRLLTCNLHSVVNVVAVSCYYERAAIE